MVYFVTALPFESRAIFHFWGKAVLVQQQGSMRLVELAPGIRLVEVGLGVEDAEVVSRWWAEIPPQVVVNVGISGALVKRFSLGDLVLVWESCNEEGESIVLASLPGFNLPKETQVTVSAPVEAEERARRLHRRTGAGLVDMELFTIARYLYSQHRAPLYSIRVVSDFADSHAQQIIRSNLPLLRQRLRQAVNMFRTKILPE